MPLFYMYTLFTDFCRYLSMQRPQTCLQKSLSLLQGSGEKKRHTQSAIFSNQSTCSKRINFMSSANMRQFLPETAIHLYLILGMFSWAGMAKWVPLCALAAAGGSDPVPCFPNRNLGVMELNLGASAAVAHRSLPAQWGHC